MHRDEDELSTKHIPLSCPPADTLVVDACQKRFDVLEAHLDAFSTRPQVDIALRHRQVAKLGVEVRAHVLNPAPRFVGFHDQELVIHVHDLVVEHLLGPQSCHILGKDVRCEPLGHDLVWCFNLRQIRISMVPTLVVEMVEVGQMLLALEELQRLPLRILDARYLAVSSPV